MAFVTCNLKFDKHFFTKFQSNNFVQKIHQYSRNFEKKIKGKETPKMRDLRASIFPFGWKPFFKYT